MDTHMHACTHMYSMYIQMTCTYINTLIKLIEVIGIRLSQTLVARQPLRALASLR